MQGGEKTMAKKMASKMMGSVPAKKGCSCSTGKMILGVILMAAGLYAVVEGFYRQTNFESISLLKIFLYYAVGIFLIGIGKFFKKASYMCCNAHNLMCK